MIVRKASKMTPNQTISVFMNINGNIYYECSLDQSIKSVMEYFMEIRIQIHGTADVHGSVWT